MAHEERFIPPRQKLDPQAIVEDYATVPRLDYRYVLTFVTVWMGGDGPALDLTRMDAQWRDGGIRSFLVKERSSW